jgi:hypothetical protein
MTTKTRTVAKTADLQEAAPVTRANDRADRIRTGLKSWAALLKDVKDAYRDRDWQTLGYASWDAYVTEEFYGCLTRFGSGTEFKKALISLSESGMSTRAIAAAAGGSQSTVARIVKGAPESNDSPVTGRDGKKYKRAAAKPVIKTVPPSADDPTHHVPAAEEHFLKLAPETVAESKEYFTKLSPEDVLQYLVAWIGYVIEDHPGLEKRVKVSEMEITNECDDDEPGGWTLSIFAEGEGVDDEE